MKKTRLVLCVSGLLSILTSCVGGQDSISVGISTGSNPSNETSSSVSSDTSNSISSVISESAQSANPSLSESQPSNSQKEDTGNFYLESWTYDNDVNYYDLKILATGTGASLKTKLFEAVKSHTTISYKPGLNEAYKTTDVWEDGTVWDMYGDFKFSLSGNACGNYKNEGDCWNKEHSMPKSWFNDASPMYSDIYHLFPTDGKINGMRSNYPYGQVGSASYTYVTKNASKTGLTLTNKLGGSSYPGYTGKVFEPDDIYKGDFARVYFYMVTAYEDKVKSWSTKDTNLGGTTYPGLNGWSTELLLQWSILDPVSEKEINRTEAAFQIQHNRNPYIDNKDFACRVFGTYNDTTKNMCKDVLDKYK